MSPKKLALVLGAILLFAFFIWPGQWQYDHIGEVPVRTNRFTGAAEVFTAHGWEARSAR